ncbi:MAG: TetR/AcrR family transcriptional regulator [Syntrophomonadaceae bacterium]|nr:TetR/AcrR family transcriptional regulator [Syntrophomonadaceae bacterium]
MAINRRAEIVAVAARLFREKGYLSASLFDITNEIGMTKPAIYYYFKAKEDILFEICMTHINNLHSQAKEIAASDLDLIDKIASMFANHMLQFHLQRDRAETYLREAAYLSLERRKFASDTLKLYEAFICDHVSQAVSLGIFRPMDSKMVVRGIGGMLNWLGNWYTPEGNCDIDYIIATHIDFIMHGLLANPDKDVGKFTYKIEKKNCLE